MIGADSMSPASAGGAFRLEPDDVHCWRVGLEVSPETTMALYFTLAPDERKRCSRFRNHRDRRRFIVARGALRDLLGRYVGAPADQIHFVYNEFGKPALGPGFGDRLSFSLSHAGPYALVAVAGGADVGVDVEEVRAHPDCMDIARPFFSATEVEQLEQIPEDFRVRAFFGCWTMKEAYVKARGQGLSIPLSSFSVPVTRDPADDSLMEIEDASNGVEPARRWSLYRVRSAPGCVGALAIEGSGRRLVEREWVAEPVPFDPTEPLRVA